MTRRRLLAVAALSLPASLLIGCSPPPAPAPVQESSTTTAAPVPDSDTPIVHGTWMYAAGCYTTKSGDPVVVTAPWQEFHERLLPRPCEQGEA